MSESKETIERIAHLAKLKPFDDHQRQLEDFNKLLGVFETINDVDVSHITATHHPLKSLTQPTRDDHITEIDNHKKYQAIAPSVSADVYLVPCVIQSEE